MIGKKQYCFLIYLLNNTMEDLAPNKEFVFKFVVIGDSGVGKSSILHYFVYNKCK